MQKNVSMDQLQSPIYIKWTGEELDIFVNDGGSIMENQGWSLKWHLELHSIFIINPTLIPDFFYQSQNFYDVFLFVFQ